MKIRMLILLSMTIASYTWCQAQDYDDIYYDSAKERKSAKEVKSSKTQYPDYYYDQSYSSEPADYVQNGSLRDVDEYNRRNLYSADNGSDTTYRANLQQNEATDEDFVYTDRIKRFHNPQIIEDLGDSEVANLYYVATAPSVELIIGTPSYYGGWGYTAWDSWFYPSYYSRYSWYGPSWGWYNSWYPGYYGSYYGGWWGDWYGSSWGWCGPSWGGHHHGWNRPGWSGGFGPTYTNGGGRRPFGNGNYRNPGSGRPSSTDLRSGVNSGRRPFLSGGQNRNDGNTVSAGGRRPGFTNNRGVSQGTSSRRPNVSNRGDGVSSSDSRGTSMRRPASSTSENSSNRYNNESRYNNNYNSSRNNGSNTGRSSSFGGSGSRGGFGSGSSSHSSGGGTSRSGGFSQGGGGGHRR